MKGANSKFSLPQFTEHSPRYMASAQSTTPVTVIGDGQSSTPPPSFSTPTRWLGIAAQLRSGKDLMRKARREMSLPEKVRQVVALQRIELSLIRRRRELKEWERVWTVDPMNVLLAVACLTMAYSLVWGF